MDIISEDIRQSDEYGKYMERLGWETTWVGGKDKPLSIFIKKIGPTAVAKILRNHLPMPWEETAEALKKHRVLTCKLEPRGGKFTDKELAAHGYKRDKEPLRATKTILIDLSPDEDHILKGFKRARSKINLAGAKGYRVTLNDFDLFFWLWKSASKIQKIWSSNRKDFDGLTQSFGSKCFCVTIDDICGALILTHKRAAYYYYAAALPEAKDRSLGYISAWEAMKEAKRRGCLVWDWEGIYDPRWPNKSWLGFSQFKKTFGGEVVDFPGSWSRWSLRNLF